jgi:hypothetical protein
MIGTIAVLTNLASVSLNATEMSIAVKVSYFSKSENFLTTVFSIVLTITITREAIMERPLIAD